MKLPMLYDEEYVKDGMKETACFDESQKDLPYANNLRFKKNIVSITIYS